MGEEKIRQWCPGLKKDSTMVHDEEQTGRPSAQTVELVEKVLKTAI